MFKLPIKQIIINSGAVVVETAGSGVGNPAASVAIEGFGTFDTRPDGADAGGFVTSASAAAAGEFTIAGPSGTIAVGDVWDLKLTFSQGPRVLSEIWSYGEQKTFQSARVATATKAGWATAMASAIMAQASEYFGKENVLTFTANGDNLEVAFKEGYEGIGIKMAEAIDARELNGEAEKLAITTDVVPSEGINLGKQIEAEVRNATFDNIDPYGIQFGGNSQGVDVRGTYTEIHWAAAGPLNGFEPHDMTGYGDANTQTVHGATQYSAFVLDISSNAAAIASLTKLAENTANLTS